MTAIATALAVQAGRGAGSAWVALAVLAGQLSVGWSNDLIDAERDRRAGRTDKPVATGQLAEHTVGLAAVTALALCLPLSFASGWRAALVHLLAVGAAWAYNLGLKGTAWSWAPYVLAFGALPAFVTLGLDGHPAPTGWAVAAGALLGGGAHLVNVLPDLDADARTGVRGLPHRLGFRASLVLGAALLGAGSVVAAVGGGGGALAAAPAVVAVAGVVGAAPRHPKLAWRLAMGTAALCVAAVLLAGGDVASG